MPLTDTEKLAKTVARCECGSQTFCCHSADCRKVIFHDDGAPTNHHEWMEPDEWYCMGCNQDYDLGTDIGNACAEALSYIGARAELAAEREKLAKVVAEVERIEQSAEDAMWSGDSPALAAKRGIAKHLLRFIANLDEGSGEGEH